MGLRKIAAVLAIALIGTACSSGGGGTGATGSPKAGSQQTVNLQVAFVYDGSIDDGGWNSSHHAGKEFLVKNLPGIKVTELENIAPGDQARATFQDLGNQGFQLVIGTTYYQDDALAVAKDFPETVFLSWGGDKTAANVGQYNLATEEGRYLDGIVAGSLTKKNLIGYPAGYPIPEVVRGIDAFILGAHSVNPDVKVLPLYVNSWWDPPKEREAAQSLANRGIDVIAHELNAPAVASVAQRNDIYYIGYGWDQSARAPDQWLSSFVLNWGPYYLQQAKEVAGGAWKPEVYYAGIAKEGITMAPFGPAVPQSVIDLVNEKLAAIKAGSLDVFAGPIYDNSGKLVVEQGQTIAVKDRPLCCDWYARGVEGRVPKS